ncbi:MAG: hypothetical protein GTN40_00860 [Candidatus Aenigmarchaeota archaeon]|nr:hypothetical protein [Candidatus Aenigmarchaeota archaeon]
MKAQSETLVFVLLFLLSVGLFTVAVFWSKDVFQQNVDMTKVSSAEKFMKDIDYTIKSLIKFGGYKEIDYRVDGPITLIDGKTIEVRTVVPSEISLPRYWNNISSDSSFIREMLDGDVFRIQLIYPENEYKIEFFTEGPTIAKPKIVKVEKNSTYIENNKAAIKIRITFI